MPRTFGLSRLEAASIAAVKMPAAIRDELCVLAATHAEEICGALHGLVHGQTLHVVGVRQVPNLAPTADAFVLQLAAHEHDPAGPKPAGGRRLGIFHSHPNGQPILSGFDCFFVERTPLIWAIIGREPGQAWAVNCYLYRRGLISQLEISFDDS